MSNPGVPRPTVSTSHPFASHRTTVDSPLPGSRSPLKFWILPGPPRHSPTWSNPAHPCPKLGYLCLLTWASCPPSTLVPMSCPGCLPTTEHWTSSCAPVPRYSYWHTCLPLLWPCLSPAPLPFHFSSPWDFTKKRPQFPSLLPLSPSPLQLWSIRFTPTPLPEVPSHLLITSGSLYLPGFSVAVLLWYSCLSWVLGPAPASLILLFLPLLPLLAMLWCLSHGSLLLASRPCLWLHPAQWGLSGLYPCPHVSCEQPSAGITLVIVLGIYGYLPTILVCVFCFFFFWFFPLCFFFFLYSFFLFTALELTYSISVLLMHADCIRFKVSWYPYLFSSNAVQWKVG